MNNLPPDAPPPPAADDKVAGHIDGDTKRKAGGTARQVKQHMLEAERDVLRRLTLARLSAIGDVSREIGIQPRVEFNADGSVKRLRALPREVRQYARDVLVAIAIPRLVAVVALGDDMSATMAANALRQMGVAQAHSTMDSEGEETALPAVVVMPPLREISPPSDPQQVAVVPAPNGNGHGRHEKIARVRKLLPPRNR